MILWAWMVLVPLLARVKALNWMLVLFSFQLPGDCRPKVCPVLSKVRLVNWWSQLALQSPFTLIWAVVLAPTRWEVAAVVGRKH